MGRGSIFGLMSASGSKVELYAAIRRDARAGLSGRALERKYRVGWRTVRMALASAWPEQRKSYPRRASRLDPYKGVVDEILRADLDAPCKQRHTAKRIFDRLVSEQGMRDVSYRSVRGYVAQRRPEIRVAAGRGPVEVFVPQSHRPGVEAEVDFGDVVVRLRGQLVTCALFSFGCRFRARPCIGCFCPVARRPSWKDMPTRCARWVGFRPARSAMTT